MSLLIRIRLLRADEGGRKSPIGIGYRAAWDNGDRLPDGTIQFHDAPIVKLTINPLPLGGEAEAEIEPAFPQSWRGLAPGSDLFAYEGRQRIATAVLVAHSD